MREREAPATKTINISAARQQLNHLLTQVYRGETRVIVEKSGIPVAAIISPRELAQLRRYEAERAQRFAIVDEIRAAFKDVPDEELEREVAKAVAQARAELRSERVSQQEAAGTA